MRLGAVLIMIGFLCSTALGAGPPVPPSDPKVNPVKVGKTYQDSVPGIIPGGSDAPKGAPNVVVVLLDDVGFAASSTFGGPVPTPNLDRLAGEGLRYNAFNTAAVCGPSRAALLTGRNPHRVEVGQGISTGYEGYTAVIPKSAATIAQVLQQNGYSTSAWGKWHNTPDWEISPTGPFDRWPTGMGFNYYYGFNAGETNQFAPTLYENTVPIEARYRPGGTLTNDLSTRVIAWMQLQKTVAPDRPFFAYWATGATHAPHQVDRAWSDRFRGHFDQGWDVLREQSFQRQLKLGVIPPGTRLTPRPKPIPAWDTLSPDRQKIATRLMEVYAGYLAETDHEIGRMVDALKASGQWDNTLFMVIVGDNGASGEGGPFGTANDIGVVNGVKEEPDKLAANLDKLGGPESATNYPAGFAWAMNTPFQWTKQVASHFGGTRNPLIVTWPARIQDRGGLRSQFHYITDIMPTVLEAAGISLPSAVNGIRQQPLDGISMAYTFDQPEAPGRRRTQYFELMSNRAIYHDGWIAAVFHGRAPWEFNVMPSYADERWELYRLDGDFSEAEDLSAVYPDKLRQMQRLFDAEARRNHVYPLDDRGIGRVDRTKLPGPPVPFKMTYYPGAVRIGEPIAPSTKNRSFSLTANVVVPADRGEGVIAAIGGMQSGWSLYFEAGRLNFVYNFFGTVSVVRGPIVAPGSHALRWEFAYDGGGMGKGGTGTLLVDGQPVGSGRVERTVPLAFTADETFDVGMDLGTPVGPYTSPFGYNGTIVTVTLDTSPDALRH